MAERNSVIRDREKLEAKAAELSLELNEQMRDFALAVSSGKFNTQAAAAEHAGYAPQSSRIKASKLMKDERIIEYIEVLSQLRSIASVLDSTELVSMQLRVYNAAMSDNDYRNANGAVDQLAKMIGAYQKQPTSGPKDKETENTNPQSKENMLNIIKSLKDRKHTQLTND